MLLCGAGLYFVPVVDQHREASLITVSPNGGNTEKFHINVPVDRILSGAANRREPLPAGLGWPVDPVFGGTSAEIFKIRNDKDTVIGIASRLAADDAGLGKVVEWVLHLPARGSLFVTMSDTASEGGFRRGTLRAGTREFRSIGGQMTERWFRDSSIEADVPTGRIELIATFAATSVAAR